MEQVIPFARLESVIEPHYLHYPKTGAKGGRPAKSLATMLHVYILQNWFCYSDLGMEEAVYDISALRRFTGLRLADADIPYETTILNFLRLLETHKLTDALFGEISAHLNERGLILKSGTLVDATIIHAPPSTKNRGNARDPEMRGTHKHGQWYIGMNAHIGVDADSGSVHTVEGSTASLQSARSRSNASSRWARTQRIVGDRCWAACRRYPDGAICKTLQISSTPKVS
jgi:transposase, IS5 family